MKSLLATIACGIAVACSPAAPAALPNIVVYLSDDHSQFDSSLYGNANIPMPNLEEMAAEGIVLDHCFVASPSCAPSRAALLTGLMPARNGAEGNHTYPHDDGFHSLVDDLGSLGYETAAFGKVAHGKSVVRYGFDHHAMATKRGAALGEAVGAFLEKRDPSRPLCLFVGTSDPHVPWPDATRFDPADVEFPPHHIDTPATREHRARYYQEIADLDTLLGDLRGRARQHLGEDTLFIHTSDHGSQWPFGKWTLYDYGTRVPFVATWPGKIGAGSKSAAMVSWVDIVPTLIAAAGGDVPAGLDGRSFLPVLLGEEGGHRERVFTTHSGDVDMNVYPSRSVRSREWKLIHNLRPDLAFTNHSDLHRRPGAGAYWGEWAARAESDAAAKEIVDRYYQRPEFELYRVGQDRWELENLASDPAQADRLAGLRSELADWMVAQGDTGKIFGTPRPLSDPASWHPDHFEGVPPKPGKPAGSAAVKPGATPPNVIVVFIDDMGWSDLSCFGGKAVVTEHIDRLANEGLRFTNFYVNSPICSPSRVALTTGQYPQRWRISSYLNNRKSNVQRGMAQWLDPAAPTLPRALQAAGYATGHFGKWHMGGQRDVDDAPPIARYGFDESLTNFEGMGAKLLPLTLKPGDTEPGRIWEKAERLGEPVTWMQRSEITGGFVAGALAFIDAAEASEKPFYINLWPDDVHGPFWPPLAKWGEGKRALYHGVLDAMDEQLARLFDRVRATPSLRDNTIIVVASDNGHEDGAGSSDPLRGAKTWLYEGGVRSPLIVWAPGLIPAEVAGTTNKATVACALDLNRALYTITGAAAPDGLDGEDLSATFLGRSRGSREAPIFWRRPPDRPGFGHGLDEDNPDLAVRHRKWKCLVNFDGSTPQLYDLRKDPGESDNIAGAHADVVRRLDRAVREWNARLPADASDPDFQR